MMMKKFSVIVFLFALLSFSVSAEAPVVKEKERYDDVHFFGDSVVYDDVVEGDLYVSAGEVVIDSDVGEDLVIFAGKAVVNGDVGEDLRFVGGNLVVNGEVGDNLSVMGNNVVLAGSSVVLGEVNFLVNDVEMRGVVDEKVEGWGENVKMNGEIGRDVKITVGEELVVGGSATVGGSLDYKIFGENVKINGRVEGDLVSKKMTFRYGVWKLFLFGGAFLMAMFVSLFFVLLAPKALSKSAIHTREHVWKTLSFGIVFVAGSLIGAALLIGTGIGLPLGLMVVLALLLAMYLGKIFAAAWVASFIVNIKKVGRVKMFFGVLLGLVVYYGLGLIPYVGFVLEVLLSLIGIGAMVQLELSYIRFLKKRKML